MIGLLGVGFGVVGCFVVVVVVVFVELLLFVVVFYDLESGFVLLNVIV